jgi:DNA-binding NtrC family response regulator
LTTISSTRRPGATGNVRELKNIIRRPAIITNEKKPITIEDMTTNGIPVLNLPVSHSYDYHFIAEGKSMQETVRLSIIHLEKNIIEQTPKETKGNKSAAAGKLGIDYKTILRKMKAYRINQTMDFFQHQTHLYSIDVPT